MRTLQRQSEDLYSLSREEEVSCIPLVVQVAVVVPQFRGTRPPTRLITAPRIWKLHNFEKRRSSFKWPIFNQCTNKMRPSFLKALCSPLSLAKNHYNFRGCIPEPYLRTLIYSQYSSVENLAKKSCEIFLSTCLFWEAFKLRNYAILPRSFL